MRIAYFDCFSGASGDMILGSLIDAGLNPRRLRDELKKLHLPQVHLRIQKVVKGGISATRVVVEGKEKKSHRTLQQMLKIIARSGLETEIKALSKQVFQKIASVEAAIHQTPAEEVHFHEVGGLDSVVDICGAVWGLRQMEIEKIFVSRINVGTGFVKCEHGVLPVPAPAALALTRGIPIYSTGVEKELLTPTGAAILSTLGNEFGSLPPMRVQKVGYGAGRDDLSHPNVLRLMVGTLEIFREDEKVIVLETNIDDMNPQIYDYVMDRMLRMEVKDVFLTPLLMKNNRPATLLTVICSPEKLPAVMEFLLSETTTIGLRWHEDSRVRAEREILSLDTKHGRIRFKVARWNGRIVNISPEYEDCKHLALEKGIPLKDVFEESKRATATLQS
jgi:uncharacterized protein (TIGR00299 family) protein